MKHSDLIVKIIWLVIGLLLSVGAYLYPIGSIVQPGSGFFPFIMGLLLIFLSLILLLSGRAKNATSNSQEAQPLFGKWKEVGFTILIMLLATFFFEMLGYLITLFLLTFILMFKSRTLNWKKILFITIGSVAGIYIVFVLLLKQNLPVGLLNF